MPCSQQNLPTISILSFALVSFFFVYYPSTLRFLFFSQISFATSLRFLYISYYYYNYYYLRFDELEKFLSDNYGGIVELLSHFIYNVRTSQTETETPNFLLWNFNVFCWTHCVRIPSLLFRLPHHPDEAKFSSLDITFIFRRLNYTRIIIEYAGAPPTCANGDNNARLRIIIIFL